MPNSPITCVLVYGQSNAHAGGQKRIPRHERLITKDVVSDERARMLNTGLLGVNGKEVLDVSAIVDIVPAREDPRRGESGGSSFMRYATKTDDSAGFPARTYLYRTFGRNGMDIGGLRKGGEIYAEIPGTLYRVCEIAGRQSDMLNIPAFIFRQGEADAWTADSKYYLGALEALADDLASDLQDITG